MLPPSEPSGSNKLANWLRKLLRYTKTLEVRSGVGYRVRTTSDGRFLELGSSGGAGGSPVKLFRYVSQSTNYIVCHEMTGTQEGTLSVNIAKPYLLRYDDIILRTIDGSTISYDNYSTANQQRVAHLGTTAETQVIVPRYLDDDYIYAAKPNDTQCTASIGGEVVTLDWIDLNADGRAWAKKYGT